MTIQARLADGRVLNFPDGTDPSIIQATVKKMIGDQSEQAPTQQQIVDQSEAKIQSLQSDLEKLNQVRNNPDFLEKVFGGVEGFLSLVSAPIATAASGIVGLADASNPFSEEGAGAARQKQVQEALTFQPRLSSGQGAVSDVAGALQNVADVGTGAVALTTAGIEGAITGDRHQAAKTFEDIKSEGVGEFIGSRVAETTGSPLLGSIARIIPEASTSFTGVGAAKPLLNSKFGAHVLKTKKPVDFKNLSATQKQRLITEEIKTGNPNIDSVTKFINEKGTVAVSKESRVALKELSKLGDDLKATQTVSVFERMNDATKSQVKEMLKTIRKTRKEPLSLDRPSDVLGKALANRAQAVVMKNKEAGKQIGEVAKSLKDTQVNIGPVRQKFFESLKELGVKFNTGEDGWVIPDFSRSKFVGGSQKDMNVLVNDLLNDNVGFEFAHNMKRSIRDNLNFDTIGASKIGKGTSENILKDLSSGIDQVLDSTSKTYNNANIKFAKTKGMVDQFQKLAGKDVDLFSDTANITLSSKAKRITSNAESRGVIGRDIKEIDEVLKDLKVTFKDDIQSLIYATNEMERIFDIAPQNSLKGNILESGRTLARGDIPIAETVGFVKKTLSPSEQKVFLKKVEVLENLTKLKGNK